ncbi:hypothetical protein M3Y94_01069800 [Aphelenchoides besseyi]|nr:hypothetical protein M3Y94_01069800 [Aphelenchoides besseyi]KAI6216260.1 hypothetical protein M3Y95_01289800 [Aphelenchoides besseyi]
MSVMPQINESSAKVEEVDQLVKLAKFEDETKLNASLVLNDKVRLRASFEDGGSLFSLVVSSLENAEVVFQQKMSEAQFKQHPSISETDIPFRSAVSTIHGLIKQSTAKNSSFRMELKVRLKKSGKTVAIFEFKGKVETAGFFDQYATSLAFELEELKSDALCRYLAQRLLKLEKANERRDTKYNDVKEKYFDLKDECKELREEKKYWSGKMKELQDEVSEWKQKYTDERSDVDEWKLLASARLRQIEGRSTGCFSPTESICFTDSSRSTTTESICFTPTDSSRSFESGLNINKWL